MKQSSKVLAGLGIGIVAGGISGYFLASPQGQKFQRTTKNKLNQVGDDMKKSLKAQKQTATKKLNAASDSAKNWANEISGTLKHKISETADAADGAVEKATVGFQSGMDKAKRIIEEKTVIVDNVAPKN